MLRARVARPCCVVILYIPRLTKAFKLSMTAAKNKIRNNEKVMNNLFFWSIDDFPGPGLASSTPRKRWGIDSDEAPEKSVIVDGYFNVRNLIFSFYNLGSNAAASMETRASLFSRKKSSIFETNGFSAQSTKSLPFLPQSIFRVDMYPVHELNDLSPLVVTVPRAVPRLW